MNTTKIAAPVLQHRNGQTKKFINRIIPHAVKICKCFANFALLGCAIGTVCAAAGLAQGGGAASLAGLIACLLGGWAAVTLREVPADD
jgi:hypothetical protein